MSPQERQNRLFNVAVCLAPSLRDKFDFSNEDDYSRWAEISFKGAEAIMKKDEAMREKLPSDGKVYFKVGSESIEPEAKK